MGSPSAKARKGFGWFALDALVYNSHVICFWEGTRQQRRRLLERCHVKGTVDTLLNRMGGCTGAQTLTTDDVPGYVFVYFKSRPERSDNEALGAVAHEMLHTVVAIFRRKGLPLEEPSEEAYTYFLEYLIRNFWAQA